MTEGGCQEVWIQKFGISFAGKEIVVKGAKKGA